MASTPPVDPGDDDTRDGAGPDTRSLSPGPDAPAAGTASRSSAFDMLRPGQLRHWQVINHFPGMSSICRKNLLGKNLSRLEKQYPEEYNFFPRTWLMPADRGSLMQFYRETVQAGRSPTFIFKPENSCQGRGINLIKAEKKLASIGNGIVQQYLSRPLLIDDHKMDIRLYVLVTTVCPEFRIFLFDDGLVRLAAAKYKYPTTANLGNEFCHLTNYSLNKNSSDFDDSEGEGEGHKRTYKWLLSWMMDAGHPVADVQQRIHDVIIKTLLSIESIVGHRYQSLYPNRKERSACCEILGFDIMLDARLKPWLLEVNQSPSFSCDAEVDRQVKESLIRNAMKLMQLQPYKPGRDRYAWERKLRKKAYKTTRRDVNLEELPVERIEDYKAKCRAAHAREEKTAAILQKSSEYEDKCCAEGGFLRIYPTGDEARNAKYRKFASSVPSLQSKTVAYNQRAKESLEIRARVLQVEHEKRQHAIETIKKKAAEERAIAALHRRSSQLKNDAAARRTQTLNMDLVTPIVRRALRSSQSNVTMNRVPAPVTTVAVSMKTDEPRRENVGVVLKPIVSESVTANKSGPLKCPSGGDIDDDIDICKLLRIAREHRPHPYNPKGLPRVFEAPTRHKSEELEGQQQTTTVKADVSHNIESPLLETESEANQIGAQAACANVNCTIPSHVSTSQTTATVTIQSRPGSPMNPKPPDLVTKSPLGLGCRPEQLRSLFEFECDRQHRSCSPPAPPGQLPKLDQVGLHSGSTISSGRSQSELLAEALSTRVARDLVRGHTQRREMLTRLQKSLFG